MSHYLDITTIIKRDITIYDFDSICRTCLCREDLKPLYEKCSMSTCLAEMLMSCTLLKFAEDDGLPVKICTNCIHEINQAFSFVKRCETIDTILRKCVTKCETELSNNSSETQTVETKEDIKIKPEIIHQTVREILEDYTFVEEVKQEVDVKVEYVDEVQKEEKNAFDENYHNPAEDVNENQVETCSEKSDNSGSTSRRRSTNSQIEEASSEDDTPRAKRLDLLKARQRIVTDEEKDFKMHKRVHTGENPNVCSVCYKVFTQSNQLKDHMRIHTMEKPYSCGICNKSFTFIGSLTNHKRTHIGKKPNICSVCSKAFKQPHQLKRHMRIHTGEKLYFCGVCNKHFTHSTNLEYHLRIHQFSLQ